jgi:hypothetical protein
VQGVAARLEVSTAHAALSAEDKLALLRSFQQAGHRVLVVGDGVNDAPVLAAADVSVAVGGGTDLAKVSADLILLGDRLAPLTLAVNTARRTLRVIRQNIAWAVLYNAAAVPLALGGWLQPWMAAVGMSASSLLVVLNAMRLLRLRWRLEGSFGRYASGSSTICRARPCVFCSMKTRSCPRSCNRLKLRIETWREWRSQPFSSPGFSAARIVW